MNRLFTTSIYDGAKSVEATMQIAPSDEGNLPLPITKEVKSIKKEIVETGLDVVSFLVTFSRSMTCLWRGLLAMRLSKNIIMKASAGFTN